MAVCRVAAVRRTGGSGVGTVSTVGLVARSHQGATPHCGSVALRCGVAMGRVAAVGLVARSHHGATLHCCSARGCWCGAGAWFLGCFLGDLLRNGEILGVGGIFFVKGL